MKRSELSAALLLLMALGSPKRALAFSDYELFGLAPHDVGGGGGRFFTASPADGYGCGVCHLGGIPPKVQLRGLPEKEFDPGVSYDVELVWLFPEFPHALNLEFVNALGQRAGTITLPDPATLQPEDLCDAKHGNEPATHLIEESAPRQVLWVDDCGARRVRFRFTTAADPQFTFAAGIVRTDASEKPDGDGVTEVRRVLYRRGSAPVESGCSLHMREASRARGWLSLCLAGAAAWLVRRRRSRR